MLRVNFSACPDLKVCLQDHFIHSMALEQRVAVLEVQVERLLTLLEEQELLPEGGAEFVFDVPVPQRRRARSRSPAPAQDEKKKHNKMKILPKAKVCYAKIQEGEEGGCDTVATMMCMGKTHKYNSYRAYCGPCGQWLIGNNSITDPVAIPGSTPTQRSAASGSRSAASG